MIERVMSLPIFMFTRVALSALITAIAGIMMQRICWLKYNLWITQSDDFYLGQK